MTSVFTKISPSDDTLVGVSYEGVNATAAGDAGASDPRRNVGDSTGTSSPIGNQGITDERTRGKEGTFASGQFGGFLQAILTNGYNEEELLPEIVESPRITEKVTNTLNPLKVDFKTTENTNIQNSPITIDLDSLTTVRAENDLVSTTVEVTTDLPVSTMMIVTDDPAAQIDSVSTTMVPKEITMTDIPVVNTEIMENYIHPGEMTVIDDFTEENLDTSTITSMTVDDEYFSTAGESATISVGEETTGTVEPNPEDIETTTMHPTEESIIVNTITSLESDATTLQNSEELLENEQNIEDTTETTSVNNEITVTTESPMTTIISDSEYLVNFETVSYENDISSNSKTTELDNEENVTNLPDIKNPSHMIEDHITEDDDLAIYFTTMASVVLEASPNLEISQTIGENPLDPSSFDLKIKTIKDLEVDAHDAIIDPNQIAKATSFQESSYSTATRSATVTTWVDPNIKHSINQGFGNLTNMKEISFNPNLSNGGLKDITSKVPDTSTPSIAKQKFNTSESESTNVSPDQGEDHKVPVFKFNIGEYETVNGSHVYVKSGDNKSETQFIYEMPDISRGSGTHLSASVVIALSVCFSVIILIGILTVSLWFCRRHKNRSKIYLSRDVARPRAFFTKPMNPALLPNERDYPIDPIYAMEFQKPRAPVVLSDDPDCVVIEGQTILKSDNCNQGIDNQGFVDIPLEELKDPIKTDMIKSGRNPPKIRSKCQQSDTDSGIKVWSSTGSLYTLSPELSHCPVPPPPYTTSISRDSVNLSGETMAALGSKARLLYV